MSKTLNLKESKENIKKKIDISDIKCQFCNGEVEPKINVSGTYILSSHKHLMDNANFYSLWSCEAHGSVPAVLNGKIIDKPTDLMNMDIVKIDDDIFINIKRLKSAVQGLDDDIDFLYRKFEKYDIWSKSNDEVCDMCEEYFKKQIKKWFPNMVNKDV